MDVSDVAADGSPVPVYLALPAEPEFTPVLDAIPAGASVLDLGCGVGRLANVLVRRGHRVTGVDESAEMLAHLDPDVEPVQTRLEGLELDRRFDVVVLASHLVNVALPAARSSFLRAAARHVLPSGEVFIEHYEPGDGLSDGDGAAGAVRISVRVLGRRGADVDGQVTYRLGRRSWQQTFTATILDDVALDLELAGAGLHRLGRRSRTWLVAAPVGGATSPPAAPP